MLIRKRNSIGSNTDFREYQGSSLRSFSSSKISPSIEIDYGPVKYYCMECGNEHREIACPKCGSKDEESRILNELIIHYQICGYCVDEGQHC